MFKKQQLRTIIDRALIEYKVRRLCYLASAFLIISVRKCNIFINEFHVRSLLISHLSNAHSIVFSKWKQYPLYLTNICIIYT